MWFCFFDEFLQTYRIAKDTCPADWNVFLCGVTYTSPALLGCLGLSFQDPFESQPLRHIVMLCFKEGEVCLAACEAEARRISRGQHGM